MSIAEIIALVTAIGALIGVIANYLRQQSTDKLTAKRDQVDALLKTVNELQERNTQLYSRICELEGKIEVERGKRRELEEAVLLKDKRISDLEAEVAELQRQVKELGGIPRRRKATGELKA